MLSELKNQDHQDLMKDSGVYEVVEKRDTPQRGNIISDEVIRFTGKTTASKCPHHVRKIVVWDDKNQREIELLTNHMEFASTTISAIYKDRWEIELFFKALKQNLKIKTFVGTTENALKIQIWTALIAILLIKYLKFKSKFNWSLSNLVALLRLNLFTYRNIWEWIDDPFQTPPEGVEGVQLKLDFPVWDSKMNKKVKKVIMS